MKIRSLLIAVCLCTSMLSAGVAVDKQQQLLRPPFKDKKKGYEDNSRHKHSCKKELKAKKACIENAKIKTLKVKQVSNDIGATYVIGVDVPTIQAGIDLASSGLKPDSASHEVPLPPGAKNVILQIPPGTYHETLFIDTSLSGADINGKATDLNNLQGRGLRLIGDTRPIAAMTYMNGGLVRCDASFTANFGLNSLGTNFSVVSLSNAGNTITVVNTPGPNPDFFACGIVPGDIIVVTDNDGNFQERKVVSVSGNTVTYDGAPVTVSGLGAALTFCPNVQVMSSIPDAICFGVDGQVEMIGIWFSGDPAFSSNSIYGVTFQGFTQLWFLNLLIDSRNISTSIGLLPFYGAEVIAFDGDADVTGHMSILGGNLDAGGPIYNGFYYVMAAPGQTRDCVDVFSTEIFVDTVQANGAGSAPGFVCNIRSTAEIHTLATFNCPTGATLQPGTNVTIDDLVIMDNCTTGFNISGAYLGFDQSIFSNIIPLTATITGSTTAIQADLNSQFGTSFPIIFNDCTNGIQLTNGSTFTSSNDVIFTAVANPYAIDATSNYLTAANAGTDPSPNNIFTYSTAGSPVMNSAYPRQLLDSGGVVKIQLTPGLTVASTPAYLGKNYTLTKISGGNHTVTLTGATFLDGSITKTFSGPVGSTMTIEVISATKVAILTSTGVT